MKRRIFGSALLLMATVAFAVWPPQDAHAQNKKKDNKAVAPTDAANLAGMEYLGLLKNIPGTDRLFTVEVEQDKLVPTGKNGTRLTNSRPQRAPNMNRVNSAIRRIQQAQNRASQAQNKLATAKNASEQNRAQSEMSRAAADLARGQTEYQTALIDVIAQSTVQANVAILNTIRRSSAGVPAGFKIEKTKLPLEFQASETVKVRTMVLAEEFDDKGNPKKPTKEELAELKGKDKTLPGYESSLENLVTGQKVRLVLASAPAKKPADKDNPDKDKDEVDPEPQKKKQVKLILILEESQGNPVPNKKGKK